MGNLEQLKVSENRDMTDHVWIKRIKRAGARFERVGGESGKMKLPSLPLLYYIVEDHCGCIYLTPERPIETEDRGRGNSIGITEAVAV